MIDAHVQPWKQPNAPSPRPSRDATPQSPMLLAELENDLDLCGVEHVIAVQAQCSDRANRFLLQQARLSDDLITAVIAWAPLDSRANLRTFLDQYIHEPLIKGVTETAINTPVERFLDNPDFDLGINELTHRGLTLDLLVSHQQLPDALKLVDRHPNQPIVINHGGCPPVSDEAFGSHSPSQQWARNIRELARRPHVYAKLSGLSVGFTPTGKKRDADILNPYAETLIQAFGADRLMFGSNWPHCKQHSQYPALLNVIDELIFKLSSDDQWAILEQTATTFYQL